MARPVCELVPHRGAMCLLDRVIDCSKKKVVCGALSHRDVHNPLREEDQLRAVVGIEYAAQAMAVHGALLDTGAGKRVVGFLGAVNDVELLVPRLDIYDGEMMIEAECLIRSEAGMLYRFELRCSDAVLLRGRATVVLG